MVGRKRDPSLDRGIVEAAAAVLAEKGYAAFAIETVARQVGIPKSTVYTRWPSRSALLAHVLATRVGMISEMDEAAGDLRSALIERVRAEIALSRIPDGLSVARAVLTARAGDGGDLSELLAVVEARRDGCRAVLERARDDGTLATDADVELALDLLLGAVWAAALWGTPRAEQDAARIVDAVLGAPVPQPPGGTT